MITHFSFCLCGWKSNPGLPLVHWWFIESASDFMFRLSEKNNTLLTTLILLLRASVTIRVTLFCTSEGILIKKKPCNCVDFQNYLRTQTGNNTTVNIIISTVDYLLRVQVSGHTCQPQVTLGSAGQLQKYHQVLLSMCGFTARYDVGFVFDQNLPIILRESWQDLGL